MDETQVAKQAFSMAREEEIKKQYEAQQRIAESRRFTELVCRVMNATHLDKDNYGLISVSEDAKSSEFKAKITAVCKEYL